jgi:hypothetical protein
VTIMASSLVNSFRKIMDAGDARDDLPFILSTSSTVIVVVFFACVGASVGNCVVGVSGVIVCVHGALSCCVCSVRCRGVVVNGIP